MKRTALCEGSSGIARPSPIDAVITWVDGQDSRHQEKLHSFLKKQNILQTESAAPTRFNQVGELDYCISSIFHFAPWIRTIHIVTDAQIPPILLRLKGTEYEKKINLVDHLTIFKDYEHYLPTFNSLSIETMLWRIPNLAEQFIYFNDDCVLLQPVDVQDFFIDGAPVVRGAWKTQTAHKLSTYWQRFIAHCMQRSYQPKARAMFRILQEETARKAGVNRRFFQPPHVPFALKKTSFSDFFHQHPQQLEENIRYKLRDITQFIPVSLIYYLLFKNNACRWDKEKKAIMVHASHHSLHKIKQRLKAADHSTRIAFACFQSLDEGTLEAREYILHWLDKRILRL